MHSPQDIEGQVQSSVIYNSEQVLEIEIDRSKLASGSDIGCFVYSDVVSHFYIQHSIVHIVSNTACMY